MRTYYIFALLCFICYYSSAQHAMHPQSVQLDSIDYFNNPMVKLILNDASVEDSISLGSTNAKMIFLDVQNNIYDVSRQFYEVRINSDSIVYKVHFFDEHDIRYYSNIKTYVKNDSVFQTFVNLLASINEEYYLQTRLSKQEAKERVHQRQIMFGIHSGAKWLYLLIAINGIEFADEIKNFPDRKTERLYSLVKRLGIY